VARLHAGEVGYFIGNIKDPAEIKIGDTVTLAAKPTEDPLPGYKEIHPMVFSGIYPINTADFEKLKASLEKYKLNDSSFSYMPESSLALGLGFRCGFLGLLHMEIVQERLRREYDVDIISTYPNVVYIVHTTDGQKAEIENPTKLPDPSRMRAIEEPMIKAFLICHNEHIGDILQLIMDRRGSVEKTETLDGRRVMLTCHLPLNEILIDFQDKLKSVSRGYASMDYEYRVSGVGPRAHGCAGAWRGRGGVFLHHSPHQGGRAGEPVVRGPEGAHSTRDVPDCDPGRREQQDHGPRNHPGHAQGCDGQVLRRRYHPQAQAAGEAERRQKEDEDDRAGQHSAGSLCQSAQGRDGLR
jgi:hypothetical protein